MEKITQIPNHGEHELSPREIERYEIGKFMLYLIIAVLFAFATDIFIF